VPERKREDREGTEELCSVTVGIDKALGLHSFVLLKPFVAFWRIFHQCLL